MNHWLVKQEPEDYPWTQLVADGRTAWTGVRNFQARNNLRAMRVGDRVFYYHSGKDKEIVGLARVVNAAHPDPTAEEGDWVAVELSPIKPLTRGVTLEAIKSDPVLREMALLKQSRLSVVPVSDAQARRIEELSRG